MKKSQLRQIIREEIKNTLNEMFEIGDSVMLPNRLSGKITKIEGDEITVNTSRGSGTFHKNNLTLLKKSYRENESTDTHINPMVAKAYREYLKAKEEGDGEKAYRYYSRKLNNTYSTRADRDFIENALRKKYGSALEEASKEEMDKFAKFQKDLQKTMSTPGWKDLEKRAKEEEEERNQRKPNKSLKESPKKMTMKELEKRIKQLENSKFSNENARELMALRSEYSYRTRFENESLKETKKQEIEDEIERLENAIWQIENTIQAWIPTSRIRKANMVSVLKKKIEWLKKKINMTEIKGFEEFKETGFKLGDKVEFMGSAHPTHIKPIKLTGTIEYFEPADEIGVRVDGYGKFIPFFEIPSSIELTEGGQLNEGLFMDVQDFNKEEYPHIHSWDETIDYNDMLSFAKDYARYVATLAAQEFMDTDIPKEAIDEFLSKFNI